MNRMLRCRAAFSLARNKKPVSCQGISFTERYGIPIDDQFRRRVFEDGVEDY